MSAFQVNKRSLIRPCVLQSKPIGWQLFSKDAGVTLCTKDTVILRMVSKLHIKNEVLGLGSMNRVPSYRPGCPSRNKVVKLSGCAILNLTNMHVQGENSCMIRFRMDMLETASILYGVNSQLPTGRKVDNISALGEVVKD